jgi:hypothetical protein
MTSEKLFCHANDPANRWLAMLWLESTAVRASKPKHRVASRCPAHYAQRIGTGALEASGRMDKLRPRARLRLRLPGSGSGIDSRLVGASCEPQGIFIDLQSPMDQTDFRQRRTG